MPIMEDIVASDAVVGAGLATGAIVAVPLVGRMLRPAAKAIVKAGIVLYRGAADMISEATQSATAAPETGETPPLATARRATAGSKPGVKRRTRPAAGRRDRGKKR